MKPKLKFSTELREAFAMALNAIAAHKLRSSLTLLGILIGVFSIIVVSTAIRALQSNIESEMAQLGSHTFQIQRFPAIQVDDDNEGVEKYLRRKRFYLPLVKALQERVTLAKNVAASAHVDTGEVQSRFGKTAPTASLLGMSPEAFETRNLTVAEGRSLAETDMDSARQVTVLGADIAAKLFPFGSPLGDWVRFKEAKYTVVGVLEAKGSMFGQSRGQLPGRAHNDRAKQVRTRNVAADPGPSDRRGHLCRHDGADAWRAPSGAQGAARRRG